MALEKTEILPKESSFLCTGFFLTHSKMLQAHNILAEFLSSLHVCGLKEKKVACVFP